MEANHLLAAQIRSCTSCPLSATRTLAVPAEVGASAPPHPLAFMGMAPGRQENATGKPFVGPAGRMFDSLLADAGVKRDEVVLLNRVRCYPPGNRLASAEGQSALEECASWVQKELDAYQPLVVVLLGAVAFQEVFGATASVGRVRGTVRATGSEFQWGARMWLPSWHPSFLLRDRSPEHREEAVEDIRLAKRMWEEAWKSYD